MDVNSRRREMPLMLSFGSWIGGDRDGNPFVTQEVTISAIADAREHILAFYREQVQSLFDLLTSSVHQVDTSVALRKRLEGYLAQSFARSNGNYGALCAGAVPSLSVVYAATAGRRRRNTRGAEAVR